MCSGRVTFYYKQLGSARAEGIKEPWDINTQHSRQRHENEPETIKGEKNSTFFSYLFLLKIHRNRNKIKQRNRQKT